MKKHKIKAFQLRVLVENGEVKTKLDFTNITKFEAVGMLEAAKDQILSDLAEDAIKSRIEEEPDD